MEELSEIDMQIYKYLKAWRNDKATQMNIPAFMICHNSELLSIAKARPKSEEDLIKIKGFGPYKTNKYGEDIISILLDKKFE